MTKAFKILLEKEIKELLRDPKIIIGMIFMPIIMFGVMGYAMRLSFTTVKEAALRPKIAVLDYDGGRMAEMLISALQANPNATVKVLDVVDINEAIAEIQKIDFPVLMVIPSGFTENVTQGLKAKVELYTVFKTLSMAEAGTSSTPASIVELFNDYLVDEVIRKAFPGRDPDSLLNPVTAVKLSVIKGEVVNVPPEAVVGIITSQSMTMPITVMMILVFAMQIAATSIAIEKEEKTLETLLSLPVNRLTILASKLTSSIIVAAIGSSVYMIGYTHYMSSMGVFSNYELMPSAESIGLTLTPLGFLLLGSSLFIAIVSALALAVTVAAFTEDVRSAQAVVGYLYTIVFIPSFILMFIDIKSLPMPLQIILYAIPYTHPILAAKAAILDDYATILGGIIYMVILTIIVMYVAAKLFTTEKILTARISLKRFRFKRSR
ncbi:MAG: ABC transporter permease [archaeon GB-1867-005]|nr:ABC transporter permease [Candidatus Culexmicrobium cathedralense]